MLEPPLTAHSISEVSLYLRITRCPSCGHGPLVEQGCYETNGDENPEVVRRKARCRSCDHDVSFSFRLARCECHSFDKQTGTINESDGPSEIIDLPQWITLYSVLKDEASRQIDKGIKRKMQMQAGACLTEALKFYEDPENDLPPATAFFHEPSRQKLKDQPELFSRQRLINLRATLPKPTIRR